MSYQVLARKWRPANFDQMVGQTHVLRALTNALDNERLHHAYLFTGTRGVGKTTIARILARCLNCEAGISSKPCGSCSSCTEITEGRFIDLIEVDAASKTKVEDTRELLENVQYRPTRGRYKVYLIDEVHMLSTSSFNALLKTLEEPPPHVVFLLATTDPQKLPPTVLSRCLQFHLKNMQPEDISNHLAYILGEESIENESAALQSISWSAKGSMRDALSLLDQAIAYGDGKVLEQDVREMLGTIDRNHVYQLITALAANDGQACIDIIDELSQFAPEFDDVLAELLAVLHRIALLQQIPDASMATQDRQQIQKLAADIAAEDIQLFYQLALHGRRDLPLAPDKRSGFEMCILRMMSFKPAPGSKGETPVKKSESSYQPPVVVTDDTSTINKTENETVAETVTIAETETVTEVETKDATTTFNPGELNQQPESAAQQMPDYSQVDPAQYEDIAAAAENDDVEQLTTTSQTKSQFVTSPLRSPLLRNQPSKIEHDSDTSLAKKEPEQKPKQVINKPVEIPEPESVSESEPSSESATVVIPDDNQQQKILSTDNSPNNDFDESELPEISKINQQNWHCIIAKASITGVTEQIALNSQFIAFDGENFEISLANSIRSMVTNEHINKLTAAFNGLYNTSCKVTVTNLQPDYETPRERKERIKQQRHQAACDNLNSDPQIQGLLKTFDANLDLDSVVTLID